MTDVLWIFVIVVPLLALVVVTVPRRWLVATVIGCIFAPALILFGALTLDAVNYSPVEEGFYKLVAHFMPLAMIGAIPWAATCLLGCGIGFVVRRAIARNRAAPIERAPAPSLSPVAASFAGDHGLPERSPDGRFAVTWKAHKWIGGYPASVPRITEASDGRAVFDLGSQDDWDGRIEWESAGRFRVLLQAEAPGFDTLVSVDADAGTFRIGEWDAMRLVALPEAIGEHVRRRAKRL